MWITVEGAAPAGGHSLTLRAPGRILAEWQRSRAHMAPARISVMELVSREMRVVQPPTPNVSREPHST
jgi:hypothetical protein